MDKNKDVMDIGSFSVFFDILGKLLNRCVFIREIRDPESFDANQFKELYNKIIPFNLQISAEIILDFVGNNDSSDIVHHLFVCKRSNKVVGFIKIMICERLRYLFIAYLGIDNEDVYAKSIGVKKLLKRCVMKYSKKMKLNIISEISQIPSKDLAMRRLVRNYSKKFKRQSFSIDADYWQPAMPDTNCEVNEEEVLTLLYVPYLRLSNNIITKEELCAIISSIYYDIYAPSCSILNGCDPKRYNNYLSEILESLKDSYEKVINLNPC